MAASDHRRALSGGLLSRLGWLGLVGGGLVLLLLAVALVQARQFSLLRQLVQSGDEFVQMAIHQHETEYLRLCEQWHQALDDRVPLDDKTLRLRYDIRREFAPYVGVQYRQAFGKTRRYLRDEGEDAGGWSLLTGVRVWF